MYKATLVIIVILMSLGILACNKSGQNSSNTKASEHIPSLAIGETIYKGTCTSCHNVNPKENGPVGPKVYGANLELLSLKILKGEYPQGYTPLRTTRVMPKFVHLEKDLKSLELYLNQ